MSSLNIILDSREQSVSAARQYYLDFKPHPEKILVKHIRHVSLADTFLQLYRLAKSEDQILISMDFIGQETLDGITTGLNDSLSPNPSPPKVELISFKCFDHIKKWCNDRTFKFTANIYDKPRVLPKNVDKKFASWPRPKDQCQKDIDKDLVDLERIWIQYRLIREIISRSPSLDGAMKQLITGEPGKNKSIEKELKRAVEYFKLKQPDMVGGTYAIETLKLNAIDSLRERIKKTAATDFHVLIQGDSGSGKESVAWAIHELSERWDKPFHTLNCAGFSDELLESELFGHRIGAFTGAVANHGGILAGLDGGTLFLDEIPDMGRRVQAKILRWLESGEYRPVGAVGGNKRVDVRIIGAGQGNLLNDSARIRPDLKARIAQLTVELFPLHELENQQPGTLIKIVNALLERYTWTNVLRKGKRYTLTPKDIRDCRDELAKDDQKKKLLAAADWSESNVRQLNNFVRHWLAFEEDEFNNLSPRNLGIGKELSGTGIVLKNRYGKYLTKYLNQVNTLSGFEKLIDENPIKNLTKAYAKYIYQLYLKVIAYEILKGNMINPSQVHLAKILKIANHTLNGYLKPDNKAGVDGQITKPQARRSRGLTSQATDRQAKPTVDKRKSIPEK